MVLHHVAEGAGFFVVAGAALHTERFAGGDLDMVDVAGVPHCLEQGVGEAHDDDVLRGFLAEVVVDAEGLGLVKGILDEVVQALCAWQVGAEGFFHNDTAPRSGAGFVEAALAEIFQDDLELVGACGEVEKAVSTGATGGIHLIQAAGQSLVAFEFIEFAAMVADI